jgi:hypothetical protein
MQDNWNCLFNTWNIERLEVRSIKPKGWRCAVYFYSQGTTYCVFRNSASACGAIDAALEAMEHDVGNWRVSSLASKE